MEGWAGSLVIASFMSAAYRLSPAPGTTQRNNIREDKAKQTKMVTVDMGEIVPCCCTLCRSPAGKITGSSSASQPAGPFPARPHKSPHSGPGEHMMRCMLEGGVWCMVVAEPRKRRAWGMQGRGSPAGLQSMVGKGKADIRNRK